MPPRPITACSCVLYPTKKGDYPILITGIYMPPGAQARLEMLETVSNQGLQSHDPEIGQLAHDPNTSVGGHSQLSHEWLSEAGFRELSNPELPKFGKRNCFR